MQWVLRAQCHDREALEALLRSVQPALRRYLCELVGSTEADDVQQDILMIAVGRLKSLEEPGLFRPWLFRIASRQAFRHIRKRRLWQERHEPESHLDLRASPEAPPPNDVLRLLSTDIVSPASRAVLWTTLMTLVVVLQITVMTKRILRAIELASKK
jgi:RNA polymerase sigma-70 factor (ECF subfamily)